jgi:hypothetical protein
VKSKQDTAATADELDDTIDVSIPYDAAARNAYEISSKSIAYPEFKVKYEAAAIELVKSKQDTAAPADELDDTIDVSIPYDAAARNAYEISSKSLAYPEFKVKYEAAAIELVKSKQDTAATADELDDTIDVSIPYDAAARNAYEISSKSIAYPEFKVKYEAAAIELVKSKQDTAATADELDDTIDVSIPYDAAARNAYEISSKSIAYPEFKVKYEAAAIELVKSKRGTWRKSGETRDEMNSGRTLVANEIQSNEENVPFPSFSKYLKKRSRKGIEEKADKERAGNEERQWNIKIVEEEKKTRTQRIMEKTQSEGQ